MNQHWRLRQQCQKAMCVVVVVFSPWRGCHVYPGQNGDRTGSLLLHGGKQRRLQKVPVPGQFLQHEATENLFMFLFTFLFKFSFRFSP